MGLTLWLEEDALASAEAGVTVMATAVLIGGDMGCLGGTALGVVADSEVLGRPS